MARVSTFERYAPKVTLAPIHNPLSQGHEHHGDEPAKLAPDRRSFAAPLGTNGPAVSGRSHPPRAVVERLIEALQLNVGARVLVVGAGSGYLPAALATHCDHVFALERTGPLADLASRNLSAAHVDNVTVRVADGCEGWAQHAPYDGIVLAAALGGPTQALLSQLSLGASVVFPSGARATEQPLHRVTRRDENSFERTDLGTVCFAESVADMLIELGVADAGVILRAQENAAISKKPLLEELRSLVRFDDRDFARALAHANNLHFATLDELSALADAKLFERVPRAFCAHHQIVPLSLQDNRLIVVGTRPDAPFDDLAHVFPGVEIQRWLTTPTDIHRLWTDLELHLVGHELIAPPSSEQLATSLTSPDLLNRDQSGAEVHAIKLFESLLLDAIGERASDIHLERYGDQPRVRIRVDGELRDLARFRIDPLELVAMVNVIKVRASLDISERRLPQGGRMRTRAGTKVFDLRVQTQPALHGEHVVIRLLPQDQRLLTIEDLGFTAELARHYRRLVDEPSSLVLVVGPTGSGKSTTLYAALQVLASDGTRKVITVEDPIEYSIEGIQQTQIKPEVGFGFADAMRAFVRQDPDVIFVGEIRDAETALEAIRASQTGHLVLSTLHCNDATDAVQRLVDLGMHSNSIASELGAVISQRLARRICEGCRAPTDPPADLIAEVFPNGVPADFRCFAGRGCARCGGQGTRGRVAVIEFMHATPAIRSAISRQLPVDELRSIALQDGLSTTRTHALTHVRAGTIPMTELRGMLSRERLGEGSTDSPPARLPKQQT